MRGRSLVAALATVFFGLMATAGFTLRALHEPGVYVAEVDVNFRPPQAPDEDNPLAQDVRSATSMAGIVAMAVDSDPHNRFVSAAMTLAGSGEREGAWVRLPNDGGQWAAAYNKPTLNVQAVGPNEDGVRLRVGRLVADIRHTARALQDELGVDPANRFLITVDQGDTIPVQHLRGQTTRAAGVTAVLGLSLTAAAVSLVSRLARSRWGER